MIEITKEEWVAVTNAVLVEAQKYETTEEICQYLEDFENDDNAVVDVQNVSLERIKIICDQLRAQSRRDKELYLKVCAKNGYEE